MKTNVVYFVLILFPSTTKALCTLSTVKFSCEGTNYTNLIHTFYETCYDSNLHSKFVITIHNSTFNKIDYFPNLPLTLANSSSISQLVITNSSVETVSSEAFDELTELEDLDLSFNKLITMDFVRFLPSSVRCLLLSNNNITFIEDVFSNIKNIVKLDLSYNNIASVDFSNMFSIASLNFSHNKIDTLKPSKHTLKLLHVDLSHNRIKTFDEAKLNYQFNLLDISHNPLESALLSQGKKDFLNLSFSKINKLTVDDTLEVDVVDLSSSNIFMDFSKVRIVPKRSLVLTNNEIGLLNKKRLSIYRMFERSQSTHLIVDLSNSSIQDISTHYFQRLTILSLNLSNNHIVLLRKNVFHNSSIDVLDLSNSNIEKIENSSFKNLKTEKILLKGNILETVKDVFDNVEVKELDLSLNTFKTIQNNSFSNALGLISLNLEHCLVEKLEPKAFFGLQDLQHLKLSNNKLIILTTDSFNNLPIKTLDLKGNKIGTIRNKAFNNLSKLKELNLSKVALCNLEPYAFNNLSQLKTIDLSFNSLSVIPHYLFANVDNLTTINLDGNNITTLNPFSNRLKLREFSLTFMGILKSSQILNSNIRYLYIVDSKVDMLKKNCFAGLYNLVELHFKNSYVYAETGALNNLFNLKFLDSQSLFKHIKIIKKGTFKDLRSLEFLDLSKLHLQTIESKAFVGMKTLQTLLLNGNDFKELQDDVFQGLDTLKVLNLSKCSIESLQGNSLTGLSSLETLYLDKNNLFSIESPNLFAELHNLLELHLEQNNITYLHNKSFFSLKKLLRLYLQGINLNQIPVGVFQYLTSLKILNLSSNPVQLLKTGTFSNLINLELLDLSNNQLINLDYVDIFFSLKKLEVVLFDRNHLKQFDVKRFLTNLKKIKYVGISYNKWKCEDLSRVIEILNSKNIEYQPEIPVFDDDNIDGVGCVDICKFVYCASENNDDVTY